MLAALYVSLGLAASVAPPVCAAPDAPASARQLSDAEVRARLAPYLGTIDRPIAAGDWRRLPPEALPVLERIAADPAAFSYERALALDGATALGSGGALHRRLAADATAPIGVRHAALGALPIVLPAAEAHGLLAEIMDSDPDSRIRGIAATVIARSLPARGCAGVRAGWRREGAVGKAAFQRAVAACEGK